MNDNACTSMWEKGQADANQLNFPIEQRGHQNNYTTTLNVSQVCLKDKDISLCWVHFPFGKYSPKEGYKYIVNDRRLGELV